VNPTRKFHPRKESPGGVRYLRQGAEEYERIATIPPQSEQHAPATNKATVSPLFCFSPKLSPTTATLAHGSRVLIP
jgi:hypothetical protein